MSARYRYGHKSVERHHVIGVVFGLGLLLLGIVVTVIVLDLKQNSQSQETEGKTRVVGQVVGDDAQKITVEGPTFSMQLPKGWKETDRKTTSVENSITWNLIDKVASGRALTLYIDVIPADKAVHKLLPLAAQGSGLTYGDISDGCVTFTGNANENNSQSPRDVPAKWQGVDFICNTSVIAYIVGASAPGGVNQVSVTGASQGTHKYFFVYTDQGIQPNYTILQNAISSFQAK